MLRYGLVLLLAFSTAFSLQCFTCDEETCSAEDRVEGCDPSTKCYTLTTKDGLVIRKGCTTDCSREASSAGGLACSTCDGELCNRARNEQRTQIGGGAEPAPPVPSIGGGAVPTPKSASQTSLALLMGAVIARIF
ncbi:unnamed protein product, partial [Mesorhabditis spiculigera]